MRLLTRRDLGPVAFLTILVLGIFYPIALDGRVLTGFDAEVYFYPNAAYLVSSLRAGRIPLWNPYLFGGVPFLANSQVGALYPPNYLYLFGPISVVASYLLVGHLVIFAFGMYGLGRFSLGLERFGATYAAAVAVGSGLAGGMVGHINQVEALAWAPFAIVLVERAVARRSVRLAALAAVPLTLALFAGHTQVVYLTLALAVAAGLSRYVQSIWSEARSGKIRPGIADVASVVGLVLTGPVLAGLIAAAQLLPTLELTRASIRSTGLDFADAAAGSFPPPYILTSLLPTIDQAPSSTEWLMYLPIGAGLLAIVGLWRRPRSEAWWLLIVATVGLLLAFGQYGPLFHIAYTIVPGFRLFRVPARWLAIWVLGLTLLAGWGADAVTGEPAVRKALSWASVGSALRLGADSLPRLRAATSIAGAILVAVVMLFAYRYRQVIARPTVATLGFWLGALAATLIVLKLTAPTSSQRRVGLLVALVLELGVASNILPTNEAVWPSAVEAPRETVSHLLALGATDRVLGIGDNTFDPSNLPAIRQSLENSLSPAAIDAYVTALKHVEGLTPNLPMRFGLRTIDGYDGGILPLARYHDFKRLFDAQGPDVTDGRLRIQLRSAPNAALLSWLNVRWLVIDRLRDRWSDGYYYDLSVLQPLKEDVPIQLQPLDHFHATRFGVVLRADGSAPPVGTLRLDVGGISASLPTAINPASAFQTDPAIDPNGVWIWTVNFPSGVQGGAVTVSWNGQSGTILRGLTAIDDSTRTSVPIVVSPSMRFSQIGDLKVYEVTTALPRAFLTDGLHTLPTPDAVVAWMRQADWNARSEAVAVSTDVSPGLAFAAGGAPGDAAITRDDPEHIVVQSNASDRRVLVLSDSYYPGWHATVDGVEVPILPVNLLFRGVILPPGRHVVDFTYRPLTWEVGLVLSGVGLLAFVAVLVWTSKRPSAVDAV